jgi:hypothetical protein
MRFGLVLRHAMVAKVLGVGEAVKRKRHCVGFHRDRVVFAKTYRSSELCARMRAALAWRERARRRCIA